MVKGRDSKKSIKTPGLLTVLYCQYYYWLHFLFHSLHCLKDYLLKANEYDFLPLWERTLKNFLQLKCTTENQDISEPSTVVSHHFMKEHIAIFSKLDVSSTRNEPVQRAEMNHSVTLSTETTLRVP